MDCSIQKEILETARRQFCLDTGFCFETYQKQADQKAYICKTSYKEGTVFPKAEGARAYHDLDYFFFAVISFGQIFIGADEAIYDWVVERYTNCSPEWFCDFAVLKELDRKLEQYGRELDNAKVYGLPGKQYGRIADRYDYIVFNREEIEAFRGNNRFHNALSFWPGMPDMVAVAAVEKGTGKTFDQSKMKGMAGASRDGALLWQIGIDVDSECRGQGLAESLVTLVRREVESLGVVPFYGTSPSHTISKTVGLKAGFVPGFTTISCKRR